MNAKEGSKTRESNGVAVVGGMHRYTTVVPDMECADCATKVERSIKALEGITDLSVNIMSRKVRVEYDPRTTDENKIAEVIQAAGYKVQNEVGEAEEENKPWWKDGEKVLTAISGVFFFAGLGAKLFFPETDHAALWQGHLSVHDLLFLIAAALGGLNFFPAGIRALRTLSMDMSFLMTIAIVGAAIIGEYTEAAAIAFLFSIAELLEDYAIDRARNSLKALMKLAPETASVKRDGQEIVVPIGDVDLGEIVVVRPGEKIPLDGEVVEGTSAVDQSPITGESMPVTKESGDTVFAGSISDEGYLEIRADRLASESTLSKIMQMVEEAEEHKAPSELFVRKFARYYTPVVTLLALGVILVPPLLMGLDFNTWFVRGLTLLVIACPCALVISTPVAVVSGITSAARNGVLIKGGNYLEALGEVRVVAFDKTGTLTYGKPKVTDVLVFNGQPEAEVLRIAAAVEQRSQHPIARAIVEQGDNLDLPEVTDFESITGKGVRARVGGTTYLVGKPELFPNGILDPIDRLRHEGKTAVLVGTESEVIGAIAVADTVRKDAKSAIESLHQQGIQRIVMLTGDNEITARTIAEELGIDEWRAELLPAQKVEAVKALAQQYGKVAMIGDGVNDAPALATASVGIAMGAAGTDVALETADVALMADDLSKLPYLFQLSKTSRGVIRQNISTSILVKFILAIGVFPGMVSLAVAVLIGDMGTSLGVTGNALRLSRIHPSRLRGGLAS